MSNSLWLSLILTMTFINNSIANAVSISKNNQNIEVSERFESEDWTLMSITGKPVTLSEYQGQPVLLVFWATWCPYCKKLLPGIAKLHEKYQSQGLKVIGVNIKEDWQPAIYWRNHGYQFDTVLDGDDIANKYGIIGTPGLVFISPKGKVLNVAHFSDPSHPSLEKFAQHFLSDPLKTVSEN
ncbi:TlpA disulfide reductase family protein [Thalassotalea castellviae]|uniref:TlpA disulfide reductase family protein n=1 Tax=Thalassotalea castellviae TaxID=3075612 RepID=A0ABU2ZZ54_9GAMM|nr:TlpA disulfide reductase family protein [Thalassotalea sp. W431]MDT0603203.1 TlpA disulfide reductase family protein [Thalassotalea sp. W431]